ncbi:hypothetical protein O181_009109 [Austropuccinia psidii MF-1]|uniref:Uncharacterized protein n=1 Tax=Austropuccinia psidii MF-1 TaxID=1389203 RepID=A0A9Q3BNQ6_9BASI|nr:hypothetical protein [Austropuccinia psidii MF-1]
MPKILLEIDDSSSDEEVIKARMTKLTRTNWVQCICQFENYVIRKGMDNLLDRPSEDVKKTTKFKKRNGGALTLLWSSNSVVVICRTLHKLVNIRYKPGSSLEKHVDEFHKIHASYLSISADSSFIMSLLSSMGAAFFLQSLDNDEELSSLCQTLYEIKLLNLNTITNRVSIEHLRGQTTYDKALLFDTIKQAKASRSKEKNQVEGGHKKKGVKEKKKGKNNSHETGRNATQEQETKKQIERIEKLLEKLQSATNLTSLNATSDSKELNLPPESDSEAFILDKVNAMIGKNHQQLIYLDSEAGRAVVSPGTIEHTRFLLGRSHKPCIPTLKFSSTQAPAGVLDTEQPSNSKAQPPASRPCQNEAPRNISSSNNKENLITGKRNNADRDSLLLAAAVPYSKAVTNRIEAPEWHKAMDAEYQSLTSHGTGELVPYPPKPAKGIGGMWRLSPKRNEHGEVYQYKAPWVVLGNHQEHM